MRSFQHHQFNCIFEGNKIGDDCMSALTNELKTNTTITTIIRRQENLWWLNDRFGERANDQYNDSNDRIGRQRHYYSKH